MSNLVPRWIIRRYIKLWKKYGKKKFTYTEAKDLLKEEDERMISIALSQLNKSGWIKVEKDQKDKRRGKYVIIAPNDVFREVNVE